jgi:hypothetical protein
MLILIRLIFERTATIRKTIPNGHPMKKFSARLIFLMETLEVSGYQLAREIGTSDMSISKYKADKALPCFEFFENLVTRYPSVNLNWLIGNHGEMFLTPEAHTKTPIPDAHTSQLLDSKNDLIALQARSLEMMEARLKELSEELKTHTKSKKPAKQAKTAGRTSS